jgi:hypothetical protein
VEYLVETYPSLHLKVVLPGEEAHDVGGQNGEEDTKKHGSPQDAQTGHWRWWREDIWDEVGRIRVRGVVVRRLKLVALNLPE